MSIITKLKQVFKKKRTKKSQKHHKVLVDWQEMYKDLHTHPLTQAKIINEQLLHTTNDAIKNIEKKVDKIDKKLDESIERIDRLEKRKIKVIRKVKRGELINEEEKKAVQSKKTEMLSPKERVKKIVADPHMSDHERGIVEFIHKEGELDAETIGKQFNISRSNASLKLNKLFSWGYLDKRMDGKTVFYRIKD